MPSSSDLYEVLCSDGGKFIVPMIVLVPVWSVYAHARLPSVMSTEPSEHECGGVSEAQDISFPRSTGGGCGSVR